MKLFISLFMLASLSIVANADPIPFSDYKFIDSGMKESEVYLRLGPPDYTTGDSCYGYECKGVPSYDAVWYGDGGSTPTTIITFRNGKVVEKDRTRVKSYRQRSNKNTSIISGQ